MRRPNNLTLDFESNNTLNSSHYWAAQYVDNTNVPSFLDNVCVYRRYQNLPFLKATDATNLASSDDLLNNSDKLTVLSSRVHHVELLKSWESEAVTNIFEPTTKVNDVKTLGYFLKSPHSKGRDAYMYQHLTKPQYTRYIIANTLKRRSRSNTKQSPLNSWETLVNINFLRKERLYTKLKYSRSPAYDIVSGGAAALLAGFIGFLITEKFGYELADSGDFYYLFMYAVFAAFSIRPLLTVSDSVKGFWDALSLKRVALFYMNLVKLFLNVFR